MKTSDRHDLSGIIGKHLALSYDNGWNCEVYIKNTQALDYRIHNGLFSNRWVKDLPAYIVRISDNIYKISWGEPIGINVSLIMNLDDKLIHGTGFFPRWMMDNPEKIASFQNEHISVAESYSDARPIYPTIIFNESAIIHFIHDCGTDNDSVIACAPNELPGNFPDNLH